MTDKWTQIVKEALDQGLQSSNGAVPGAKLRQLITRIAMRNGEQYPPEGHEEEKFSDFLNSFGSLVMILRREGQDILVAPVDQPQLLDSGDDKTQLRPDIFEAFTHIPRGTDPKEPWYSRTTDAIRWLPAGELSDRDGLIKIPPATLNQEIEDRTRRRLPKYRHVRGTRSIGAVGIAAS